MGEIACLPVFLRNVINLKRNCFVFLFGSVKSHGLPKRVRWPDCIRRSPWSSAEFRNAFTHYRDWIQNNATFLPVLLRISLCNSIWKKRRNPHDWNWLGLAFNEEHSPLYFFFSGNTVGCPNCLLLCKYKMFFHLIHLKLWHAALHEMLFCSPGFYRVVIWVTVAFLSTPTSQAIFLWLPPSTRCL